MNHGQPSHRWASAASDDEDLGFALATCLDQVKYQLGDATATHIFCFVSTEYSEGYPELVEVLRGAFPEACLLGCSGSGVIGGGEEYDVSGGLSITVASLPGVQTTPIHRPPSDEELPLTKTELLEQLGQDVESAVGMILLPDPFSFNPMPLLDAVATFLPGLPVVGGLAGGGEGAGDNTLFLNEHRVSEGLVGLVFHGNLAMDTVVAQGCRPVGVPFFVTSCEGNVLLELDGRPALDMLRALFQGLPEEERDRLRTGLLLGIGMRQGDEEYAMGDFVVRNILGMDPTNGSLGIGAQLETHRVVQFHVRDGRAASEDLRVMLRRYRNENRERLPVAGLLFSCLGRGSGLFGVPNHDTALFHELVGELPVGGFFCNGEIGPVRGRNYLHGFTSAFALFREREDS